MRLIFLSVFLMLTASGNAQTALPAGYINQLQQHSLAGNSRFNDSLPDKKWFISKSIGISTSFGFFGGSNETVLAVPLRLQLNRKLNNNLYGFAGVSAAPAYVNFNRSFLSSNTSKFSSSNGLFQSNKLNIFSRAELGLIYINDQKTFSISGSIGIERSNYSMAPFNQMGIARPNVFIGPGN